MPPHDQPANKPTASRALIGLYLALVAGSVAIALLLARLAVIVGAHWAPLLIYPLLCGGVLGASIAWLGRAFGTPRRGALIVAALAGLVFSAGQHYFAYRDYRLGYERTRQNHPQVQLLEQVFSEIRPKTFAEFLADSAARGRQIGSWHIRGRGAWFLWSLEALAATAAAIGAVHAITAGTSARSYALSDSP